MACVYFVYSNPKEVTVPDVLLKCGVPPQRTIRGIHPSSQSVKTLMAIRY